MKAKRPVLGFDVGGQSVKAALVAGDGEVLAQESAATGSATDPEALIRTLGGLRERLAGSREVAERFGVGVAGVLDRGGVLRAAPHLPRLIGHCIESRLVRALGGQAVVHNDADCAALAEAWGGAADGRGDFLLLTLGTGVGSGLVLSGSLRCGASGHGCEFGHTIVVHEGRRCGCGNRGCLEAYVSETAARRRMDEASPALRSAVAERIAARGGAFAQALFELGAAGNAEAEEVVVRMIDVLGSAIASAVNVLDLTTVVLGGGIAPGVFVRVQRLREAVAAALFARPVSEVELLAASRGPWAGAIGAARGAMLR